jgi:ATP-dependent Lon protease
MSPNDPRPGRVRPGTEPGPTPPLDGSTYRPRLCRSAKIQAQHLQRLAVVYVRQSSPQQVLHHRESTALQYDLRRYAVELGWPPERVLVIDDDQATSGQTAVHRSGYHRLLEEVDLIGIGKIEGDPVEAVEEALRWDGRDRFTDRYLDLPFDLSDTLFMATAQDFYRVPRELRDLMVEIRIAGYTPEEKVAIARERLLPRMVADHGLATEDVDFDDEALFYLARGYARDAGLGLLRRNLATLLRTRARAKAMGELGTWTFAAERIEEILGLPRYVMTVAESAPEIGVVTGLAWTAAGGELMFIEALKMPGSGRLIITGLLGDVMRESVNAAYSYVRSRGDLLAIPDEAFRDFDVHVHFPVGAIPKDGPSAGIAVTLAVASRATPQSSPWPWATWQSPVKK